MAPARTRSMAKASPPPTTGPRTERIRAGRQAPAWRSWLLLGLAFGLGYGLTFRLLGIHLGGGPEGRQLFGAKAFPGTSLQTLRQRHGGETGSIRGDLEHLEQERLTKKAKEDSARRQAEMAEQDLLEAERAQRRAERARLEALQAPEPTAPLPKPGDAPIASPLLNPPDRPSEPPPLPEVPPAPQP
jgi:hypothetical protein